MAAQSHDRATDRCRSKVLQPARPTRFPDLRKLVGCIPRFCGRGAVFEQNEWTVIRGAGRNVVVGSRRPEFWANTNQGSGVYKLRRTTMATREITAGSVSEKTVATAAAARDYARPLAVVTTLFFMWGFLTCLNDILVPHLKSIFDLNYA